MLFRSGSPTPALLAGSGAASSTWTMDSVCPVSFGHVKAEIGLSEAFRPTVGGSLKISRVSSARTALSPCHPTGQMAPSQVPACLQSPGDIPHLDLDSIPFAAVTPCVFYAEGSESSRRCRFGQASAHGHESPVQGPPVSQEGPLLTSPTGECVCLPQDSHGVVPALFSRNVTSSTTMSSTCTPIMTLPSSEAAHSKHSSEMLDKTMTSNYHPQGARASGFVVGATSSHRVFFSDCLLAIIMLFTFSRDVFFFWDSPLVYHPQGARASGFVVGTTSSHRDLQCFPFTFSCDFLFSWDSPAVSDARVFGIVVCHCTAMDHSMMGKESRFFSFCLFGSLHMPAAWVFGSECSAAAWSCPCRCAP